MDSNIPQIQRQKKIPYFIITILTILILAGILGWIFIKNSSKLNELDRVAKASVELWCANLKNSYTPPKADGSKPSITETLTFVPYEGELTELSSDGFETSLKPDPKIQSKAEEILKKYGFENEIEFEKIAIKYKGSEEFLEKTINSKEYLECTSNFMEK